MFKLNKNDKEVKQNKERYTLIYSDFRKIDVGIRLSKVRSYDFPSLSLAMDYAEDMAKEFFKFEHYNKLCVTFTPSIDLFNSPFYIVPTSQKKFIKELTSKLEFQTTWSN